MTKGSVNALQQSIPGRGKDIPDELGKRIYRLERSVLTRVSMSYPLPLQRDEPFEEGTQTNKIVAPNGILEVRSALSVPVQTPLALVNGANNDVAIGNATFIRIGGPSAAYNITGFSGGADSRILFLFNAVRQTLTLKHLNVGSLAANRIFIPSELDTALRANGFSTATFIYSTSAGEGWVLISTT